MIKKRKIRVMLLIALTMVLCVNTLTVTRAGIIDDLLKSIGLKTETEQNVLEETIINKEVEEYLDSNQKEVLSKIDEIFGNIKNVDIDSIKDNIDYVLPKQVINNIEEYFRDYSNGKNNVKAILNTLKYQVDSITTAGDKVIAKITYTYPSADKLISKVLPEVLIKNAGVLFSGQLNNDNLDSILETVKKELEKERYEVETFTREFNFKKIDGTWKLVDVGSIVKDAEGYINNISKNFFK